MTTSPKRERGFLVWKAMILACASGSLMLAACQDEKVVNYKPFFSGLEGVKTATPPVAAEAPSAIPKADNGEEMGLVKENQDGSVTLVIKSGRNLMAHIQRTLAGSEDPAEAVVLKDQFTRQVLSEITRGEYQERGRDPGEAYDLAKKSQKDIAKMFNRMPMGEYSPNVLMDQIGRNMIRVRLTGQARRDLTKWTGFDMVLEKGNWRLRWFVP